MRLQDVAFLPSRAISYTTFLKDCGGGKGLWDDHVSSKCGWGQAWACC